jgi:hypothetical protein
MCAIIENRIRINKIMSLTLSLRLDNRPPNLEELTHLCVVALEIYYDGKCPEECLEARARDLPPGTSPGSAMILQQASGNEGLSVWMDAAMNAASSVRKAMIT